MKPTGITTEYLALPGHLEPRCFQERWNTELQPLVSMNLTLWDTFEWGVWFGGYILYSQGSGYYLCGRDQDRPGGALCEEEAGGARRFWGDFITCGMREKLRDLLGLRALAPVAQGTIRVSAAELRDDVGKIVCRVEWLAVISGEAGGNDRRHFCRILPLLGYGVEAEAFTEYLAGLGAKKTETGPLATLLSMAGREPRKYTLRPAFGLEKDTAARDAAGRIVRTILDITSGNIPGIIRDLDTEFLHDYRICLRKIRSLLGLLKNVYPAGEVQRIRKTLGNLARRTNRLRDLDVYLLARDEYLELVPPGFRPALDAMFGDFAVERKSELRRVISHLRSPVTRRLLEDIRRYFSGIPAHESSPDAELAIGPLVYGRILKQYRKIRKKTANIGKDAADEAIHQLRIECKKLRYLLEFFSEIIPKHEGAKIIGALRGLQNRLGDFNDASVQRDAVLNYWENTKPAADVSLGLGGLVTALYHRQLAARSLVEHEVREFRAAATAAFFKRAFRQPVAAAPAVTENPEP